MLLNMGQLMYIIYQRRPVKFDPELEEAYQTLFHPFKVQQFSLNKVKVKVKQSRYRPGVAQSFPGS